MSIIFVVSILRDIAYLYRMRILFILILHQLFYLLQMFVCSVMILRCINPYALRRTGDLQAAQKTPLL